MKTLIPWLLSVALIGAAPLVSLAGETISDKSAHDLVEKLRPQIPNGWTVTYIAKDEAIEISRNELTAISDNVINPAPVLIGSDSKPKPEHFVFFIVLEPLMSREEYARLHHENEEIEKKRTALLEELKKSPTVHGVLWIDYSGAQSDNPQEEAKIREYIDSEQKVHRLPDGYFEDVSLSWGDANFGAGNTPTPYSPSVRQECVDVFNRFTRVLQKY
jgi:hypothetical protein